MKRVFFAMTAVVLTTSLALANSASVQACQSQPKPIVSGEWLAAHDQLANLVIIDVRPAADYAAGHITGSINIPFQTPVSAWVAMRDDLLLELPDSTEFSGVLGQAGITRNSLVVLVAGMGQPPYPLANATRAADTLIWAGVKKVSILDGGYPGWVAQGRDTSTDVPVVTPTVFEPRLDARHFTGIEHVASSVGKSVVVDARDAAVYSGETIDQWASKPGHIPSAVSLPATAMWNADGTYKSRQELRNIVNAALGNVGGKEIIVYCSVGGYASSWLFVLTRVLGYQNVKMYDGSAQEWVKFYDMEL